MNPHKLYKINKKEMVRAKDTRRKSQFNKKFNELNINKINVNLDDKYQNKDKISITNSTSPTIQDVKKRTKRKKVI